MAEKAYVFTWNPTRLTEGSYMTELLWSINMG